MLSGLDKEIEIGEWPDVPRYIACWLLILFFWQETLGKDISVPSALCEALTDLGLDVRDQPAVSTGGKRAHKETSVFSEQEPGRSHQSSSSSIVTFTGGENKEAESSMSHYYSVSPDLCSKSRSLLHFSHLIIALKTPCVSGQKHLAFQILHGNTGLLSAKKCNTRVKRYHYTGVHGENSSLLTQGPRFYLFIFTQILLSCVTSYLKLPVELQKCCLHPGLAGNIYKSMKNR